MTWLKLRPVALLIRPVALQKRQVADKKATGRSEYYKRVQPELNF